jgi:hypothetical protein
VSPRSTVDAERRAMQRRGKLIGEQATIKAQLAELHHCKFKLESERDIMVDFTTA